MRDVGDALMDLRKELRYQIRGERSPFLSHLTPFTDFGVVLMLPRFFATKGATRLGTV